MTVVSGSRAEIGLGSTTAVSLAAARELAAEMRQAIALGRDPRSVRAAEPAEQPLVPTFGDFAADYIASVEAGWRNPVHRQQWRNSLRDHASGLQSRPVDEITTEDVLAALQPIWLSKPETAKRVRGTRLSGTGETRGLPKFSRAPRKSSSASSPTRCSANPRGGDRTEMAATPKAAAGPLTANWLVLLLLLLSYAANFADRTIINVLGEAIRRDLKLSDTQLGLLGGLSFALLYSVLSIPVARYSDRHSRVGVLSLAIAFWSAATMMCAAAGSFVQLLLARTMVGVGESGCSPPAQSLITDYFPRARRAFAISVYYIGVPLGTFGGAIFAGTLAENYGWRTAFIVVGAPGLLLALAVRALLREPPRGRFDPPPANDDVPSFRQVLGTLWRTPGLRNIAAGTTLAAFTAYSIGQFLHPLFVRDFGLGYAQAALAYGFISALASMIGSPAAGALADRLARRDHRWLAWLPGTGLLLAVPLHLIGVLQNSWPVLVACLFTASLVASGYHGPTYAAVHNRIAPRMRATTTAILMFLSSAIGLGFGPLLTGMMSDAYANAGYGGIGAYRSMCLDHDALAAMAAGARQACAAASGQGVRYAIATIALTNLLAASQYFWAAWKLRADEEPGVAAEAHR